MAEIKRAIALGFFDGVHIGHAALMNRTLERAAQIGARASVMSFDVHPDTLVFGREIPLINSITTRKEILRRYFGIDDVVFLHFNRHIMCMPWREFIESLVKELNIGWIVVGHDFSFGSRGEGNPARLREFCGENGIGLDVIEPVMLDGRIVSSTYIRTLIESGDMENAQRYLGHPHLLADTAIAGCYLGSPTVIMHFPDGVIVPRRGVYAAWVCTEDGRRFASVTYIGSCPSVSGGERVSVESHLLDCGESLYGSRVMLEWCSFLRPERIFADQNGLAAQIAEDTAAARAYFDRH